MAITNAQRAKINKMNRASQDVSLGTIIQGLTGVNLVTSGSYATVSGDATGSVINILTGTTSIKGQIVDIRRSGSIMYNTYVDSSTGSKLKIVSTGSAIAAGDVVNWIVF